jgi:integrating conjugative element membrane protein (TIGR03747 family)
MGQQTNKRQESTPPKRKQRGVIGTLIHLWVSVFWVALLAWFFLSIGFGLYQMSHGEKQAQGQLDAILKANMTILKNENHFLIGNAYTAFEVGESSVLEGVLVKAHALEMWQWLEQKVHLSRELVQQNTSHLRDSISKNLARIFYPLLTVLIKAALIIGTRVFIFFLSLPLFLLFVGLGLVDGLVQRDVRKFQAARESTYLFHRIKRTWKRCFFVPLFLYFAWPLVTNPVLFLMPMAIGLGVLVQLGLQSFKKYV